ncbi:MAG TPA: TIGR01841 family phasin [Herbaspirillum sp.]|jgi:phasin family protein
MNEKKDLLSPLQRHFLSTLEEKPMSTLAEQVSSAVRNHTNSQHAITVALSDKVIEYLEELFKLHIEATNAIISESGGAARELLSAKNPQDFFLLSAKNIKRDIQNSVFYGSEATRIMSSTQTECNKAMAEKFTTANRHGSDFLIEITKNVPMGADHIMGLLKSAWGEADAGKTFSWAAANAHATNTDSPPAAAAKQASRGRHNNRSARAKT